MDRQSKIHMADGFDPIASDDWYQLEGDDVAEEGDVFRSQESPTEWLVVSYATTFEGNRVCGIHWSDLPMRVYRQR